MIPAPGTARLLRRNDTPDKVATSMTDVIQAAAHTPEVASVARDIKQISSNYYEALCNIARYAYDHIYFQSDPPHRQLIRTPRRSLIDKRGNCVDYTVFICSVARALGMVCVVRIVRFPGEAQYTHVYPLVNGVPVDVVPIQDQSGNEFRTRRPGIDAANNIGVELPFSQHLDFLVDGYVRP